MVGYIFLAENKQNGKKFIGKNLSVKFNKKYLGDNPELLSDLVKMGTDNFTVTMLRACETVKECEMVLDAFIADAKALDTPSYYNYVAKEEPAPKKRKKKVEE